MKTPIRRLSARQVEILARSSFEATVNKGYVERYGLRWFSHALSTWGKQQRALQRVPRVTVLFDELDLLVAYVELPTEPRNTIKAYSTQPHYTQNLSLFEHEKLKAELKRAHTVSRLHQMDDEALYALRLEYHAALGRAGDPVSRRRLEKLRDQLAERSLQAASEPSASSPPDATIDDTVHDDRKAPARKPRPASKNRSSAAKEKPAPKKAPVKAKGAKTQSRSSHKTVAAPSPKKAPTRRQSPAERTKKHQTPNFPLLSVKRTPR